MDPFRLFLNETVEAAVVEGGGEAVEPEAAAVEPVAAPDIYASPEFRDAVAREAQEIAEATSRASLDSWLEELASSAPQPAGEEPTLDPFDPESVAKFYAHRDERLLAQIDERLNRIQAPMAAREEQETIQRGEERLKDVLADDISRNGDFATDPETGESPGKQLVRPLADILFPQFEQRYGAGPRAAEEATVQAARIVRQLEAVARKSGSAQELNRLNTLAGVNAEPGTTTNGVVTVPEVPLDNRSLALKYGASANAIKG